MKCYEITFSPTGGTQKAADLLTKELSGECTAVDLTKQDADFSAAAFTAEDLAVIAVPVLRRPGARSGGRAIGHSEGKRRAGGTGVRIWKPGL